MSQRALILLHPGFEEMEAIAPIDLLARAGVEVVQASTDETRHITGRSGVSITASEPFSAIAQASFDAVILPGGPGIMQLRAHPGICTLLQRHKAAGKLIACICAAPLLLLDAGLIEGQDYTAHPSTVDELPHAAQDSVVLDGQLLTSRGAGTATEFALALVEALSDTASARAIAQSICLTL